MSLPSKVRKAKGTENPQATKTSKADNKQESIKQSEKAQPTAEQMRIAQIIDTKTEDPSLKEKLKQVMDATQKSIDDAYTALHDCDNDANRAVNLLLEGIESEWSTSSKKKKNRTATDKNIKEKEVPPEPPVEENHWDGVVNSKPAPTNKTTGNIRGRGRGFRGGRITTNTHNSDTNDRVKKTTKVLNGPGPGPIRGRGGRGRPQGRGFGRGRGTFRRPMDTWDPQRPVSSNLNHDNPEDWENEEYTGSLANSQIYTSSGTGNSPPSINSCMILGGTSSMVSDDFDKKNQLQVDISSGKSGNILNKNTELNSLTIPFLKSYSTLPDAAISSPVGVRSPTMGSNLIMISPRPERTSILMTSQQNKDESNMSEKAITPPIGVRSPPTTSSLILMGRNDRAVITSQEIRMHKPRPKIPPPSKIPATAVEMPPDSIENNIGLLDVQFGALELNETNDPVQISPPTTRHSPSPVSSEKLLPHQSGSTSDSLLLSETSFSPVRNNGASSLPPISDLTSKVSDVSSSLYQEPTYQTLYSKTAQQSPSVYSSTYSSGQITSTSSIIYSTSSSQSTYSSSTGGVYGGISSSYPQYQYNSYPSQQTQTLPILTNSSNSYQSVLGSQQYGSSSQSLYGTSGLPTASYTTPYQTYNSSIQHNHKQALVSSTSSSSKEFDSSQPSVNLSSISHSGSINPTPALLSGTQTTPTSKPTSISSMGKSTVVTNMPPGVPPLVGTHQYIMGQGGIPYFQQPMYYEDLQLMQQQRLAPHIVSVLPEESSHLPDAFIPDQEFLKERKTKGRPFTKSTGYYEMGYPTSTTREGVQYNMSDGRFARTDNTSPVQASSISQQSGSQAHQQPMMNPTAIPPAYAYFYGGSAMIPGNFQYGAPTLYPSLEMSLPGFLKVAAGGTTSTHGSTSSGVYGKNPNTFSGSYGGIYENSQGTSSGSSDFKTSTSSGTKVQPTQTNSSTTSDITANIYSTKSHSALSKSYEKQGFHCATPPPFNIGSQNSGMGPGGGYPQHLFIPAMTPHHNTTTLMHQPIHQDGSSGMSGRSQGNQQAKVVMTKPNYSSSTYWTQN